jgi:hypothetical protein
MSYPFLMDYQRCVLGDIQQVLREEPLSRFPVSVADYFRRFAIELADVDQACAPLQCTRKAVHRRTPVWGDGHRGVAAAGCAKSAVTDRSRPAVNRRQELLAPERLRGEWLFRSLAPRFAAGGGGNFTGAGQEHC